jgi:hypothetical protein
MAWPLLKYPDTGVQKGAFADHFDRGNDGGEIAHAINRLEEK